VYRRVNAVVAWWDEDDCIVRNYARGTEWRAGPAELAVLGALSTWQDAADLARRLGLARAAVRRALVRLFRAGLIESADRPQHRRERALEAWTAWMPSAAFFHLDTRTIEHAPIAEGDVQQLEWTSPPPDPEPETVGIPLPAARRRGAFPSVLLARRTWRHFGRGAIAARDVSTLLDLTWGTQRWIHPRPSMRFPLKTSPSGGACHSLEAYVLARRVRGLRAGLYRYQSDTHTLIRIGPAWTRAQIARSLGSQAWTSGASAVFFITSRFEKVQWKYSSPRAYRVVLLEAGHFSQTFCLVATWLGLAPFCTAALADAKIERRLRVDGISESVIYAMGVGKRPAGPRWAPLPATPGVYTTSPPARRNSTRTRRAGRRDRRRRR